MKKLLLFLLISVLFINYSCNDKDENIESKTQINFQLIGKGELIGNSLTQQNLVITNSAQWTTLLNTLDANNDVSGGFTETNIDFNQYMVIAVFDQTYLNGGHSIDIIAVDETASNLEINVEKLLQGNVTSIVTQPYHIVKIPKIAKPVTFY
ncbi:protease complex subunit PrcB family protein [Chryseobacterium binzhouense]|uniref:protease complex subunit PrcB family protein n=1 Tax=Chryseobacterium binzhouense TaxID=2593646 RepID=UPI00117EA74B|nr:protease complex subunit PrcB family protein [Chryseobacterium binzhouense]